MPAISLQLCSYAFWDCATPAIARGGPGYLVTYTGDSSGDPTIKQHVFGRMFWQFNAYLPLAKK